VCFNCAVINKVFFLHIFDSFFLNVAAEAELQQRLS
jgi:hypothetical protein